jgi:hypothetical protein
MNTGYYFTNKIPYYIINNLKPDLNLVRISISYPKNIKWLQEKSRVYKPLCPEWDLINQYKQQKIGQDEYTLLYYKQTLDCLDPQKVYNDLGENAILLCWEKPGLFCHRHIVANWLKKTLDVESSEL